MSNRVVNFICRNIFFIFILQGFFSTAIATENHYYFLTLADIHFDPFASCQTTPCSLVTNLQHAPYAAWAKIFAAQNAKISGAGQDTNYALLTSTLAVAKQAAEKNHIQFVIILGDFLRHDFRRGYKKFAVDKSFASYQSFVRKTFEFLSTEIAKTFPVTDVYVVIGNNDSYVGDYVTQLNGRFFKDYAQIWSRLIKTQENKLVMQKEFAQAGYYAVNLPQTNMRLIVLNTNLFSNKARGKNLEMAAQQELSWLQQQLLLTKQNQQKTLLAMHIPMGVDIFQTMGIRIFPIFEFWRAQETSLFRKELNDFSLQIVGILNGHVHMSGWQLLTFGVNKIPFSATTSVSPIYGNQPGLQVYSYTDNPAQLLRFDSYPIP